MLCSCVYVLHQHTESLKTIYFAYFHSTMKHGIISVSNSSYSKNMFTLQQKTVRMIGAKPRNSSRDLLKGTEILQLPLQHTVSFMDITVNNQEKFHTNSVVHSVNTGMKPHTQRQTTNLSRIQKSTYHAGIKICNSLPNRLTSQTAAEAKFKGALRQYLYTCSFHSIH